MPPPRLGPCHLQITQSKPQVASMAAWLLAHLSCLLLHSYRSHPAALATAPLTLATHLTAAHAFPGTIATLQSEPHQPSRLTSPSHLTSHISHLTSHITHLTLLISHLTSHISHISHLTSLTSLTSHISHLTSLISHLTSHITGTQNAAVCVPSQQVPPYLAHEPPYLALLRVA